MPVRGSHNTCMRTLTIYRRVGPLGGQNDATILSSESVLGVLKTEEEKVELPISKGEHAIQAQIVGDDGRVHRSNVYFATGGKSVTLYLTISGYKLTLRQYDTK